MRRTFALPRVLVFAAALSLVATAGRVARSDETDACLAAYENAQRLRKEGRLRASREQLGLCVQATCPNLVKRDCSRWTAELETMLPTVIVNARDPEGKDVLAVRVWVDGSIFLDKLDGKPHEIDPGVHVFRYV